MWFRGCQNGHETTSTVPTPTNDVHSWLPQQPGKHILRRERGPGSVSGLQAGADRDELRVGLGELIGGDRVGHDPAPREQPYA